MLYPKVAQVKCAECKKYNYNLRTGKRNTYEDEDGNHLPVLRVGDPPCQACPRKGPENEETLKLSFANRRMLDFYHRYKAVPGWKARRLDCPTTQRNILLIDRVFEKAKVRQMRRASKRARREKK